MQDPNSPGPPSPVTPYSQNQKTVTVIQMPAPQPTQGTVYQMPEQVDRFKDRRCPQCGQVLLSTIPMLPTVLLVVLIGFWNYAWMPAPFLGLFFLIWLCGAKREERLVCSCGYKEDRPHTCLIITFVLLMIPAIGYYIFIMLEWNKVIDVTPYIPPPKLN